MTPGNYSVSAFCLLIGITIPAISPAQSYGKIPLYFEENCGQTDAQFRYVARTTGLVGLLTADGWTIPTPGHPIAMHVRQANPKATFTPENPAEGVSNYYLGASVALTGLHHYAQIRVRDVRPGIDLLYHGSE